MSADAEDAGNARDAATQLIKNKPNLHAQDFKTFTHAILTKHRKYKSCGECWECSRLATKKCKKPGFFNISQKQPSKTDTSNPPQIP